jgi:hypothetical protein
MWNKQEVVRLTEAITAAGDTSASRRVLDRLMGGEVALSDAIRALESLAWVTNAKV